MKLILQNNSPIMQFIRRFVSLIVQNLLYLYTCIPNFTVGTSLTALYGVVFRLDAFPGGKNGPTCFPGFPGIFPAEPPLRLLLLFLISTGCTNAVILSQKGTGLVWFCL